MTALGTIATIPPEVVQGSSEQIAWGIDMTNATSNISGATVTNPASTLTDITNSTQPVDVSLIDPPQIVGIVVIQPVRAGVLTPGHRYRLAVTFEAASSSPPVLLTEAVNITCPI